MPIELLQVVELLRVESRRSCCCDVELLRVEMIKLVLIDCLLRRLPAVVEWQLLQLGEYVVCMLGCWLPIIIVLLWRAVLLWI